MDNETQSHDRTHANKPTTEELIVNGLTAAIDCEIKGFTRYWMQEAKDRLQAQHDEIKRLKQDKSDIFDKAYEMTRRYITARDALKEIDFIADDCAKSIASKALEKIRPSNG